MSGSMWRDTADARLRPLFAGGRQPTRRELIDAYPFGPRKYHPYKMWLEQVRWFKAGCPDRRRRKESKPLKGQERLPL
jgi:hypothetical protein